MARTQPGSTAWIVRRVVAAVLVVLAAVCALASVLDGWVETRLLSTDRWVATVGPLSADPGVRDDFVRFLSDQVTGAIELGPLQDTFRSAVHDAAVRYVGSDAFSPQWVGLNRQAQEAAVRALRSSVGGSVTVNLLPLIASNLTQVEASAPLLFGLGIKIPRIDATTDPDAARAALSHALHLTLPADFGQVTLLHADRLAPAGRAVRTFDGLFVFLIVLTVTMTAGAFAASVARPWTGLGLGVGFVVAASVGLVAAATAGSHVVAAVHAPWKGTADAIVSTMRGSLDAALWALFATGAVVAAGSVAAVVSLRLRGRTRGR